MLGLIGENGGAGKRDAREPAGLCADDVAVNGAAERKVAKEQARTLSIKAPGIDTQAVALSGGNQQKVVLSTWLSMQPRADVRARNAGSMTARAPRSDSPRGHGAKLSNAAGQNMRERIPAAEAAASNATMPAACTFERVEPLGNLAEAIDSVENDIGHPRRSCFSVLILNRIDDLFMGVEAYLTFAPGDRRA